MRLTQRELNRMIKDNPNVKASGLSSDKNIIEILNSKVDTNLSFSDIKSRDISDMKGSKESDSGNIAENKLFKMVYEMFPEQNVQREVCVVEGRGYRSDVAIIFEEGGLLGKGAIKGILFELDGYRHHGLSKTGFKKDREKDRLTLLAGYLTVRFYASEILNGRHEDEHFDYLKAIRAQYIK